MQRPESEQYGDTDSLASVDLAPYMGFNNSIRSSGYNKAKNNRRYKSTENVVSSFQMHLSAHRFLLVLFLLSVFTMCLYNFC